MSVPLRIGHMATAPSRTLADFGTRSIVTHAIMAVTFLGAVVSGLFVEGELGLVSAVAFINFTAGMWICQSIHSLGNSSTDDDYEGVLKAVRRYVD
jgi:membrane protein required for beta-lactamase induction